MQNNPRLAITIGDPAGIGPEIIVDALNDHRLVELCRPLVIGDGSVLESAAEMKGIDIEVVRRDDPATALYNKGTIEVWDQKNVSIKQLKIGALSRQTGHAAYEYIIAGADLCLSGVADALITGPINKEALHLAGHTYSGHTEILASVCKAKSVAMMLVAGKLRVSHISTHVSLRRACELVIKERILRVISLTHSMLTCLGLPEPGIAVAGLNPHAGEAGLFGVEEREQITPAIREAREQGFNAHGPYPPDIVFHKAEHAAVGDGFDGVIAMYHDQGHIPTKLLGFHDGVNVTLGLPIIRTSVDHGTAFDIAGSGLADPSSLKAAIRLAIRLSSNPD
jgi:4-hydroxythreonine-4-phosphate dehydrogenase